MLRDRVQPAPELIDYLQPATCGLGLPGEMPPNSLGRGNSLARTTGGALKVAVAEGNDDRAVLDQAKDPLLDRLQGCLLAEVRIEAVSTPSLLTVKPEGLHRTLQIRPQRYQTLHAGQVCHCLARLTAVVVPGAGKL